MGIANSLNTNFPITLSGTLTTMGSFGATFTFTGATGVTFPTSGTLATTANANVSSVTGTGNQISASPTFGAVVLSLPTSMVVPGTLTLNADPTGALEAATKQYVDATSAGLKFLMPCQVAGTANLNALYVNGVAGVGATLTNAGTLAAFSVDGVSPALNDRILVKNQSSSFQNGIYTLTTIGSGAVAWVLTRATDYDTAAEINVGDIVLIQSGTVNASSSWLQTAMVTTIGTDPIVFIQFTYANPVTNVGASSPLSSTGGSSPVISLAGIVSGVNGGTGVANTGSTITIGGNFAMSGAFAFTGTLTGVTNVTFPTSGTLATTGGASIPTLAQGDLLYASATNTLSALAKNASATRYLSNTGTSNNPAWSQVDVTTGITGIVPIANGGTGTSTVFAPGSIVFQSFGNIYTSNPAFTWDDSFQRLGIGTSTPVAQLNVTSNSVTRNTQVYIRSPNAGIVLEGTSANIKWNAYVAGSSSPFPAGGLTFFYNETSNVMNLSLLGGAIRQNYAIYTLMNINAAGAGYVASAVYSYGTFTSSFTGSGVTGSIVTNSKYDGTSGTAVTLDGNTNYLLSIKGTGNNHIGSALYYVQTGNGNSGMSVFNIGVNGAFGAPVITVVSSIPFSSGGSATITVTITAATSSASAYGYTITWVGIGALV